MMKQNRPEWVGKAAKAVAALNVLHQKQDSVKANVQASEAVLKAGVQETEEKIAEIIYRHFQEQRA